MKLTRSIAVLFCTLLTAPVWAQPAMPTMADIQQDYAAQKYQDVIQKVVRAIQVKGPAAAQYDKSKLLVLRAESHLRLKQFQPASDAFAAAAKEATDEKVIGMDKAMALLVKRSPGGMYTPKQPSTRPVAPATPGATARPAGINIIEPDSRKLALGALFNDELKANQTKIDALSRATSVPPLMQGIKQVGDLRELEVAATGKDVQSKKLLANVAGKAGQLMSDALKQMADNVEQIAASANQSSQTSQSVGGTMQMVTIKRGLFSNDISALNDIIETSNTIAAACEAMESPDQTGSAAGADAASGGAISTGKSPTGLLANVGAEATHLASHAEAVLKGDYGATNAVTPEQINPNTGTNPRGTVPGSATPYGATRGRSQ